MMKNAVQLQAVRPMSGDTVYDEGHTTWIDLHGTFVYNVSQLYDVSTASGKFERHSQKSPYK